MLYKGMPACAGGSFVLCRRMARHPPSGRANRALQVGGAGHVGGQARSRSHATTGVRLNKNNRMIRKAKRTVIQIVNAHPGSARYTSARNAQSLVDRHHAAWFVVNVSIEILPQSWTSTLRRMEAAEHRSRLTAAEVDREITANRRGVCYWNGAAGPHAMRLPGMVRS